MSLHALIGKHPTLHAFVGHDDHLGSYYCIISSLDLSGSRDLVEWVGITASEITEVSVLARAVAAYVTIDHTLRLQLEADRAEALSVPRDR